MRLKKNMRKRRRRKKIVVIFNGYLKKSGGVAEHAKITTEYLQTEGFKVRLWSRDKLPKALYAIFGVIHKIDKIMPFRGFVLYSYFTGVYLKYKYRNFDYFIFEDVFTPLSFYNKRKKIMVFIHASKAEEYSILMDNNSIGFKTYVKRCKDFERKLLKKNQSIYTVSEEYAHFLKDYFELEEDIPYIYNYLNEWNFTKYEEVKKENVFYYIGRLNNRKNPLFLLEVAEKLQELKVQCSIKIIGDGELREELERGISDKNLENVTYLGLITDKNKLFDIVSNGKALLLPSTKESFSYVLAEAKLLGLRTLLTKGLEVPDYLIDYALELEVNQWVEAITEVVNEKESESAEKVRASKELVISKFNDNKAEFVETLKKL